MLASLYGYINRIPTHPQIKSFFYTQDETSEGVGGGRGVEFSLSIIRASGGNTY